MIIDAHAHIFDRLCGRLARGAVRGLTYGRVRIGRAEPFRAFPPTERPVRSTPETLLQLMDWAGVDKAILLQNNFYGDHNAGVVRAARRWPDRFLPAMYLDPWAPQARETFRRFADDEGLRTVKLATDDKFGLFALHPRASLRDQCCQWLWPEMERRRMTLTLDLGSIGSRSYETGLAEGIARRHPRLKLVICHLAQPAAVDEADAAKMRLWKEQVLLARRPNVWLDLAALPHKAGGEEFPWPSTGRWLRRAIQLVEPKKLLWGTDMPGLLTAGTYPQLLHQMDLHLAKLSRAQRQAVLGLNALRAYPF